MQSASATVPGEINNTTQSLSGQKTFTTGITGTLTGHATLDLPLTGGTLSGSLNVNTPVTTSGALNVRTEGDGLTQGFNLESNDSSHVFSIINRDNGNIFYWTGSNIIYAYVAPYSGIGGGAPQFFLDVNNADNNTSVTAPDAAMSMAIKNTDNTAGNIATLAFADNLVPMASIVGVFDSHTSGAQTAHLAFTAKIAGTTTVLGTLGTAGLNLTGLTASEAVVTDASKNLISKVYTNVVAGSTIVSRDVNGNSNFNNIGILTTVVVSSGTPVVMTYGSSGQQTITGSSNQTFNLPDTTYLILGQFFKFNNNSTGTITVNDWSGALVATVPAGGYSEFNCTDNSTQAGAWDAHPSLAHTSTSGTSGTTVPGTFAAGTTVSGTQLISTITTGTAPLAVTSTTQVANLNAANAGTVTTNANLTGPITSTGNATSIASQTGTGTKFVVDTSPTLITPVIGAATGTSLSVSGQLTSTIATGTAPLVVTSTTQVANLNAATAGIATDIAGGLGGQILYQSAVDTTALLANGSAGQLLQSNGTTLAPTWVAAPSTSPLTTKGDIYTYSSTNDRQPVPNDYGDLIADSSKATGWRDATYTQTQGKPGKNYIQYSDFENNATTGWTLGTIGTLTNGLPTGSPTFGSGANANLSIATTGTSIEGAYSLNYVSSAATTAGNMLASSSYAIDAEDQAKVLTVKFYYSVPTGVTNCNFSGTSSNSFAWALWDVTNSSWLSSAGNFNLVQSTGCGYVTGTCQTNITTANIRLIIYNANATSNAATITLDGFYVGPQTAPSGPAMTDWVAYTPTFTGFGTPSGVAFYSRRVGDSLQIRGSFTQGTTTAVPAVITIGYNGANANVTIDGSKMVTSVVGFASIAASSATYFGATVIGVTGTSNLNFGNQSSATNGISASNASNLWSAEVMQINAMVPIVGWSSNSVMSSDTATNVVEFNGTNTVATGFTGTTLVIPFTAITDTNGGWNGTSTYTIPVSGKYKVTANIPVYCSGTVGNASLFLYKNGSTQTSNYTTFTAGGASTIPLNWTDQYSAGDTIQLKIVNSFGTAIALTGTTTGASAILSISRISGPAVISAVETTSASYNTSSSSLTGSLATVTYSNKIRDDHAGYASGTYTIPVSGSYMVTAGLAVSGTFALNGTLDLQIQQGGSASQIAEQKIYSGGVETALAASASTLFYCLAGDTIKVQASSSATTPVIVSSASQNYFSIVRVGN